MKRQEGCRVRRKGAAYFIPTVVVQLLWVACGFVFRLLLQGDGAAASRDSQRAAQHPSGAAGPLAFVSAGM